MVDSAIDRRGLGGSKIEISKRNARRMTSRGRFYSGSRDSPGLNVNFGTRGGERRSATGSYRYSDEEPDDPRVTLLSGKFNDSYLPDH